MVHPESWRDWGIDVAEEVLEECFEIEDLAVEDVEVFELGEALFDEGLSFLLGGALLLLDFRQESVEVIGGHDAVLRVLIEQGLDLRRCFLDGELEAPLEAEAHFVGLLRHGGSPCSDRTSEPEDLEEIRPRRCPVGWGI